MRTQDLDYELPESLIATEPPPTRDGGRLLVVDRARRSLTHASIRDLTELLPAPSLLVVNDTRVIRARLRGHKPSGGQVEVFLVRAMTSDGRRWRAMARASKALRDGTVVRICETLSVRFEGRDDEGLFLVELLAPDPWAEIERCGEVPLPPYMRRRPDASDESRYQTVYADRPGAVAAPTAGLHLTREMLDALRARGVRIARVTLHVGPGTFSPVTVEDLDQHPMHSEWYEVPDETAEAVAQAKREGVPVIAVGTTAVRALESWGGGDGPRSGETRLLIQPGYTWRVVDQLLTNFHLPRSTLLALVMSLAGVDLTRRAYAEAVARAYRFFSYGGAMLVR